MTRIWNKYKLNTPLKRKVFVGLSGGVDSAVSAYLLQKQGYDVRGVFMKNWTGTPYNLAGECNWRAERDDAEKVAKHLNIPFEVWNFEHEYRTYVIDPFFRDYTRGRTPNPDVRCNQYVKIPLFLKRALKEGGDFIATGHYARVKNLRGKDGSEHYALLNGIDSNKDQSYFLYGLKHSQLKHILFPVGEITKPEVRAIAKKIKLPVAHKADSQGICFVGEVRLEDFLKIRISEKPGPIVNTKGLVIGVHRGLAFYTIGQRQRLGLAGGPWYVLGRKWKANKLIVGTLSEQKYLLADTLQTDRAHYLTDPFKLPAKLLVRHRYRHPMVPASIKKSGNYLIIKFGKRQRAITPGQSAVFYKKTKYGFEVVGGAVINKVLNTTLPW